MQVFIYFIFVNRFILVRVRVAPGHILWEHWVFEQDKLVSWLIMTYFNNAPEAPCFKV